MIGQLSAEGMWPPTSSTPNQGTRTTHGYTEGRIREALHTLHPGAWWTGVKVDAADISGGSVLGASASQPTFRVKLIRNDGTKVFPAWTQTAGDWQLFPWPIPAVMARELGMCLSIKRVIPPGAPDTATNGIITHRTISFLECPDMSATDSLLFLDDEGGIQGYWDGLQWEFAERNSTTTVPRWGTVHVRVPTSESLVTRPGEWASQPHFTPISWSSTFSA